MLKDLFNKGKCTLGYHVEAWRYVTEDACRQTSQCARCQAISERVLHEWPDTWRQLSPTSCQMVRVCRRCREQDTSIAHEWGPPVYAGDAACEQVRKCVRCRTETPAGVSHVWDAWRYDEPDACAQTLTCSRCAVAGPGQRIGHNWNEWQHSPFYQANVRVCRRCAEMIFDVDPMRETDSPLSLQRVAAAVGDVLSASSVAILRDRIAANRAAVLGPVGDRYLRFAIDQRAHDEPTKEALAQLATVLNRCRDEGVDAVLHSPAPAAVDAGLVGHWRHTETFSSGGVSLVTDTHMELEASGSFTWWSHSAGSAGETRSTPERGHWSANDAMLQLTFANGNQLQLRYVLEGGALFCPDQGRYRLWQQVG